MKLLLDTHALLWWWTSPNKLSVKASRAIESPANTIFVSPASAYEIGNKSRLGKLSLPLRLLSEFSAHIQDEGWTELPVALSHALLASQLASDHRDPFDRCLAAQAICENAFLISADDHFATFPELQLWW